MELTKRRADKVRKEQKHNYFPLLKLARSLSFAACLLLTVAGCYNPLMEKIMNHKTGEIPEPAIYRISLSDDKDFGTVAENYQELPQPYTVIVKNAGNKPTGDLKVTLSGTNIDSFTLSNNEIPGLDPDDTDSFTVVPKPDLDIGVHTAAVMVTGGHGISGNVIVSFSVGVVSTTSAAISGIIIPVAGEAPNTDSLSGTGNFSIDEVSWSPNHTLFEEKTAYTVSVTLNVDAGYTFSGLETATINGNTAFISENNAASVIISYTFPETDASIASAAVTVIAPQKNDTPINTASTSGNFTITAVSWSSLDADNIFKAGIEYTATVTLTANTGFTFYGLASPTINGFTAIIEDNSKTTVTISHKFLPTSAITGGGTEENPFVIDDKDALGKIGIETSLNGYFVLTDDVVLDSEWTPIGDSTRRFTGTFDGNGKSISDLTVNSAGDYHGMFGAIGPGGEIKNLILINSTISGASYIGSVTGLNYGTVESCCMIGTIVSSTLNETGGIVGLNYGIVKNCYTSGSVSSNTNRVGGVVGTNDYQNPNAGQVINCYSTCAVSGPTNGNNNPTGGIVGENKGNNANTKIQNCVALNEEISGAGNSIGRVVGANSNNGTLINNYGKSDMQKKNGSGDVVPGAWKDNASGIDGADVTEGTDTDQYNNQDFWEGIGWDFTDIWFWDSYEGLPRLQVEINP